MSLPLVSRIRSAAICPRRASTFTWTRVRVSTSTPSSAQRTTTTRRRLTRPKRRSALRGRSLQDLQRLPDECGDVRRHAGGDQVVVDDHLLVDDVGARLLKVAEHGLPRGHPIALVLVRGEQELRSVADREDGLARGHERLHELHRLVVGAQLVGARATRDQEGFEVVRFHAFERLVDLRLDLALAAFEVLSSLEPDDRYLMTAAAESVVGVFELRVLEHRA